MDFDESGEFCVLFRIISFCCFFASFLQVLHDELFARCRRLHNTERHCAFSAEQGRERRWDLLFPFHAPRHHLNHQCALFLSLEIPQTTLRAVSIDSVFPRLSISPICSRSSSYLSPTLHPPSSSSFIVTSSLSSARRGLEDVVLLSHLQVSFCASRQASLLLWPFADLN